MDIIGIGALVVAVLGIIIAIYFDRKSQRRSRRELTWSKEIIPLLSSDVENYRSVVQVSVAGEDVKDPHLVRLKLQNTGTVDIESSAFDQGRPLRFTISETDFIHYVGPFDTAVIVTDQSIQFGPDLFPAGQSRNISFITQGKPRITLVDNYLTNVKVRELLPTNVQISRWTRASFLAAVLSTLAATVAIVAQYITDH